MRVRNALVVLFALAVLVSLQGCVQGQGNVAHANATPANVSPANAAAGKVSMNFSVDENSCAGMNPYTPPKYGILSSRWEGNTLVVEGFVKTFCGGVVITGDYSLQGNNLKLYFRTRAPGPVTTCNCAHGIRYEFTGLEHKEYYITLEPADEQTTNTM